MHGHEGGVVGQGNMIPGHTAADNINQRQMGKQVHMRPLCRSPNSFAAMQVTLGG
jgi:hypothetical protein